MLNTLKKTPEEKRSSKVLYGTNVLLKQLPVMPAEDPAAFLKNYAFQSELEKLKNAYADKNLDVIIGTLSTMASYLKTGQWDEGIFLASNALGPLVGLTSPDIESIEVRRASLACLSFLSASEAVAAELIRDNIFAVISSLLVNRQQKPDLAVTEYLGVLVCELLITGECSDALLQSPFLDQVMRIFGEYLRIESVIPEICRDELVFMEIIYFLIDFLEEANPDLITRFVVFFVDALNAKHHWLLRLISDFVSVVVEKWPASLEIVIKRGLLGFLASFLLVDTVEFWPFILKALRRCLVNANEETGQRQVVGRFLRIDEITAQVRLTPVGSAAAAAMGLLADVIVLAPERAGELQVPELIRILLENVEVMPFDEKSEVLRFILNVIWSNNGPGIEAVFGSGLIGRLVNLLDGCKSEIAIFAADVFLNFLTRNKISGDAYEFFFNEQLLPIVLAWMDSDDDELAEKAQALSQAISRE